MAKKKKAYIAPTKRDYEVTDQSVGKKLGPHVVQEQGGRRVVRLTDKEAKFYLDQDVIVAV